MQKTSKIPPTLSELDRDQLIARIHQLEKKLEFAATWQQETDQINDGRLARLDFYYTRSLEYQSVIYVLCPGKAEQVIQHADQKALQHYTLLKSGHLEEPLYEVPPHVAH